MLMFNVHGTAKARLQKWAQSGNYRTRFLWSAILPSSGHVGNCTGKNPLLKRWTYWFNAIIWDGLALRMTQLLPVREHLLYNLENTHTKYLICAVLCMFVFLHVAGVPVFPRPQEAVCLWAAILQCRSYPMAFPTVWMAWVLSCMASTACPSQVNTS